MFVLTASFETACACPLPGIFRQGYNLTTGTVAFQYRQEVTDHPTSQAHTLLQFQLLTEFSSLNLLPSSVVTMRLCTRLPGVEFAPLAGARATHRATDSLYLLESRLLAHPA